MFALVRGSLATVPGNSAPVCACLGNHCAVRLFMALESTFAAYHLAREPSWKSVSSQDQAARCLIAAASSSEGVHSSP